MPSQPKLSTKWPSAFTVARGRPGCIHSSACWEHEDLQKHSFLLSHSTGWERLETCRIGSGMQQAPGAANQEKSRICYRQHSWRPRGSVATKSPICWTWRCKTWCLSGWVSALFRWHLSLLCPNSYALLCDIRYWKYSTCSFILWKLMPEICLRSYKRLWVFEHHWTRTMKTSKLEWRHFALRHGQDPKGGGSKMLQFKCCLGVKLIRDKLVVKLSTWLE